MEQQKETLEIAHYFFFLFFHLKKHKFQHFTHWIEQTFQPFFTICVLMYFIYNFAQLVFLLLMMWWVPSFYLLCVCFFLFCCWSFFLNIMIICFLSFCSVLCIFFYREWMCFFLAYIHYYYDSSIIAVSNRIDKQHDTLTHNIREFHTKKLYSSIIHSGVMCVLVLLQPTNFVYEWMVSWVREISSR